MMVSAAAGRAGGGAPVPVPADAHRRWLRRLAGCCWRYPRQVVLALAGSLAATLAAVAIPLIQRDVVDNAILSHRQSAAAGAAALAAAAAVSVAGVFTRRYVGGRVSLDVQHDLRTQMFAALSRLDGARQDQLHTGQIVSRSISDITMVQGLLGMVPMLLGNLLMFVLSLAAMAVLSPLLTLVALATGPALFAISVASRNRLFPASWAAQQRAADVAAVVDGAVTGVRVVKGFGQEDQETGRLEAAARALYAARVRAVRLTARFNPALQAVPALGQVGVLGLGGWLAIRGQISLGTFLAFSSYIGQLVGPVRALSGLITIGQQARASVIRVFEVIDSRPVITEREGAAELPAREAAPGGHAVELDDVTFGYLPSEPVLRGLSLTVRPGQVVAVVGTSGSGKSTIALLLPRFYDVSGGAVRIGGHDVRDLTLGSLRAVIGLVMEDSFLFSDTVRANIGYGRPDATTEQIIAAARAAEAHEFIIGLPDGYDTVIGEQGLTLSGGQRQRIALARALLTDPAILVLDDATSAIDARVEAQIHQTLRRVMAGRTTLLIAHRRSTLALADQIAVLDQGRLADMGTHEELLARCPRYRMLIAGPGGDAEGVDAGELAWYEDAPAGPGDGSPAGLRDGGGAACAATGSAPDTGPTAPGPGLAAMAGRAWRPGSGSGGSGGSGLGGALAGLPPSPELLAKVAALPPATDTPGVDRQFSRAADPRFTLRRLVRPFAAGLAAGLLLDGLDALAGLALPWLTRGGVDQGIVARRGGGLRGSARGRARRLGGERGPDRGGRPQRRAAALHAQGQDLRPSAAPGPGLLRAGDGRADHDTDDHRRGRDVDVPADRADHDGQLRAHLHRRHHRPAAHQHPARPGAVHGAPGAGGRHGHVPGAVLARLRRRARAGRRGQREPAGECRRPAGRPGVPPRAGELRPVRRPLLRVPRVAPAGAALHRAVLPVHPGTGDDRGRARPARRRGAGPRGPAHRGRPDRVPALHRHALLAGAADVAGVRRLPAGGRRAAADLRAAADTDEHAAARPSRHPGAASRRDRVRPGPVRLPGRGTGGAGGSQPAGRARRDRRAGRGDRGGQVHPGQARRPVP